MSRQTRPEEPDRYPVEDREIGHELVDVKPSFATLADALTFVEDCLTGDDKERLFDACLHCKASEFMRPHIIEDLYSVHVQSGLRSLYLDTNPPITFPNDTLNFKLGGHASELGHIHIDFKRTSAGWQLESVWKCR